MNPPMNFPSVPIEEVPLPLSGLEGTNYRPLVLVVDHEQAAADALAETLAEHGFAAVTAYDGPEAIETALIMPPDLLIANSHLPGITGLELASALKDAIPDCKTIVLSAPASSPQSAEAARRGKHRLVLLDKSVRAADLIAQVEETLKLPD